MTLILKQSKIQGVGVFTDVALKKGIKIWLSDDSVFVRKGREGKRNRKLIQSHCVHVKGGYWCPVNFEQMHVGWYLNHSKNPNVGCDRFFTTLRDIRAGEELTIDYKELDNEVDNSL